MHAMQEYFVLRKAVTSSMCYHPVAMVTISTLPVGVDSADLFVRCIRKKLTMMGIKLMLLFRQTNNSVERDGTSLLVLERWSCL